MDEHRKKADKMSALLRAAASGKLWSKHGGEDGAGSCNDLRLQDIEDVDGIRVPEGSRDESRANTARRVVGESVESRLNNFVKKELVP